jgi:DNA-binding transcriptional LysR family regulator
MNIRGIDLNLLTVLHALLEEEHVSRAARQLALSQPATSSALERCRRLFDDPLLERVGSTMRLTAKAEALRQPLAEIMADIGGLVAIDAPLMKDVRQTVHIVMADALATTLAPALHAEVSGQAPGIELVLHPWGGGEQAVQQLARGTVDLAVSVLPETIGPEFHTEVVDKASYRVVMRRDHPAAPCFDLDRWLSWPHIIVSSRGGTRTSVDDALAALGHQRRIGMVVPSFLLVPAIIRRSDMVALLPTVAFGNPTELGLVAFDPPLPLDSFTLRLAWHRRRSQDRAVQFVVSSVRTLIRTPADGAR